MKEGIKDETVKITAINNESVVKENMDNEICLIQEARNGSTARIQNSQESNGILGKNIPGDSTTKLCKIWKKKKR